jgi:hypothetical protein
MRFIPGLKIGIPVVAVCLCLQGQNPPGKTPPGKDLPIDIKGLPPRATPADYPEQAEAGKLTLAAEFQGHAVPTLQGNLTAEDYVTVEAAFFGPAGARAKLSYEDFSLRINGKKTVPALPYGAVLANVKDPEWVPPEPVVSKEHPNLVDSAEERAQKPSSSGLKSGGGPDQDPPPIIRVPLEVQRLLHQRVQKAALPEGDRALPVAGLIFFSYTGKVQKIRTIELLYAGAAGKATLTLEP